MNARMENTEQNKSKSKRLKIVIVILSVLLVLSAGGLVGRHVYLTYFAKTTSTVTVPDNLIDDGSSRETAPAPSDSTPNDNETTVSGTAESVPAQSNAPSQALPHPESSSPVRKASSLSLYQGKPDDNERFEVRNMLPGDTETKYFCVRAYHNKDITLFFRADVTEQIKALGDVLHIKITHLDTGKVLCDAPLSEINGLEFSELLKTNADQTTTAYYQIDVSLDTSVGNEYQAAELIADFNWYVKDEGGLTPPQTGDTTNIAMWVVLALSSLMIIILLLFKRRKEDEQYER